MKGYRKEKYTSNFYSRERESEANEIYRAYKLALAENRTSDANDLINYYNRLKRKIKKGGD